MDEDDQKGQGGVEDPAGESVPEGKVTAITQGGARLHLACLPGGRQIEETDQRLDGDAAFQAWIKAFEDFDR
jgi:hypothetical protein